MKLPRNRVSSITIVMDQPLVGVRDALILSSGGRDVCIGFVSVGKKGKGYVHFVKKNFMILLILNLMHLKSKSTPQPVVEQEEVGTPQHVSEDEESDLEDLGEDLNEDDDASDDTEYVDN